VVEAAVLLHEQDHVLDVLQPAAAGGLILGKCLADVGRQREVGGGEGADGGRGAENSAPGEAG